MKPRIGTCVEIFMEPKNRFISFLLNCLPFGLGKKLMRHTPEALADMLYDYKPYMSPRLVELPFIFKNIGNPPSKILDAGCNWSTVGIQLASLGHKVWGADFNDYQLKHPNFTFIKTDICKTAFDGDFFDYLINISVIEHIGLGYYGDPVSSADHIAVKEFFRILKPGGALLLTTHYGMKFENKSFRIYDNFGIQELLKPFKSIKTEYFQKTDNSWMPCPEEIATNQGLDERNRPNGLILITAKK
ncbi:MAG: class I SAM-dependent methyltransferase [Elusimicrobiota bacterium]